MHHDARDVVIAAPLRTPIGRLGGALAGIRPDDLLAHAFAEVIRRTRLEPSRIDEVIAGCANQAGEDNRNVARMAALLAGVPESVPGFTVNRLCASSLTAVNVAARCIAAGEGEVILVGGVESMSRAPYSLPRGQPQRPASGNLTAWDTALGWRYPNPRLAAMFPLESMGETAENLVSRHDISREDQDAFALESHRRAVAAQRAGDFEAEIVPVRVPQRRGEAVEVATDEGPRAGTSLEALARLRPAFREGGSVTAGNSSTLNDGAAALLVMSRAAADRLRVQPIARFVTAAAAGVDPQVMGIGPVPATSLALARAGWSADELDLVELNEAFAGQALAVMRSLELDPARVNVRGGAIALGHPLGMSGARILTTLLHAMAAQGASRGLATLCVGVGQGVATLVERES